MKKGILALIITILVVIVLFDIIFRGNFSYEKYNVKPNTNCKLGEECVCEEYYGSCICFGLLLNLESYPPQFRCIGLNFCKPINPVRIECRKLG